MAGAVVVLGAGATKADGGPLTNEILPEAMRLKASLEREGYLALLEQFLERSFHLPKRNRKQGHYPPLPLLLSLLDKAIDQKQPLSGDRRADELPIVRDALEYAIFALLERKLRRLNDRNCWRLIQSLCTATPDVHPTLISLNYDLIADNALMSFSEQAGKAGFPDYGCDVATESYQKRPRFGQLFKLHGSLNWLYCPNCARLDVGVSDSGRRMVKTLNELYRTDRLDERYACHGSPCRDCGAHVRPVMITPTHMKDYRNPHIARVWYEAARALREADRVIFIGYSLPDDDVDVTYLFKRHVQVDDPRRITVVEYDDKLKRLSENPVGLRYRALFGDQIDWHPEGFGAWLSSEPFRKRPARRKKAAKRPRSSSKR